MPKKDDPFTIRVINLKLLPTPHQNLLLDKYVDDYITTHSKAVEMCLESNRLEPTAKTSKKTGYKYGYLTTEQEADLKDELTEGGIFSGYKTHFGSVLGKGGVNTYYGTLIENKKDLIRRQEQTIKKLEAKHPKLVSIKSKWFNPLDDVGLEGDRVCAVCGKNNEIEWQSNQYKEEFLCQVCFVDWRTYRKSITGMKKGGMLHSYLYEHIFKEYSDKDIKCSEVLKKIINESRAQQHTEIVLDYIGYKQQRRSFEEELPKLLTLKSKWFNELNGGGTKRPIEQCSLCGGADVHCKSNKYEDEYLCKDCFIKFKKYRHARLITERIALAPSNKALNYHQKNVVKNIDFKKQTVFIRINGKEFTEIRFNGEHYYEKFPRYGFEHKKQNFRKLIDDILNKGSGGNTWILRKILQDGRKEFFLSIPTHYSKPKSEYPVGGCIIVSSRAILLYINGRPIFIKLWSNYLRNLDYKDKVPIIQKKNDKLKRDGKPLIPIPKKFSKGNLAKHNRFQGHLVSRKIVEFIKHQFNGNMYSLNLIDLTYIHSNKESTTPLAALTSQIMNKLEYDGLYGKKIYWKTLAENLKCPKCGEKQPLKGIPDDLGGFIDNEEGRYILRDILLSKQNNWVCTKCDIRLHPLIMVAKNMMSIKEEKHAKG